nr:CYP1 [Erythropodium caribaeorum]
MLFEAVVTLFLIWFMWFVSTTYNERKDMPPGPVPLPFIGNIHQLGFDPFLSLENLTLKYGDIFTLSLPGGPVVFINRAAAAEEGLLTRKDDLAGRLPHLLQPLDVILEASDILCSDYGASLMFRRKVFKSALHIFGTGIGKVEGRVTNAVHNLVRKIEKTNGEPFSPKEYVASAMLIELWKWLSSKTCSFGHPTIRALLDFNKTTTFLITVGYVAPFLKYLPTTYAKNLKKVMKIMNDVFVSELRSHRDTYVEGVVRDLTDSFLAAYKEEETRENVKNIGSVEDIKGLMVDVIAAGSDTTSTFIDWFILYMAVNQDVQDKLQSELDRVVGRDGFPRIEDADHLHHVQSTMCEMMRITCFVPAVPHSAFRDTTVRGYKITKGTTVVFNTVSIHKDPERWGDPRSFRPARFLDADGKFTGWTTLPGFQPFSIGRRQCPGMPLAKIQAFTFITTLLHNFHFEIPEGAPTPSLKYDFSDITVLRPADYQVVAVKRK